MIREEWVDEVLHYQASYTKREEVKRMASIINAYVRADIANQIDARADELWDRNIRRAKDWREVAEFVRKEAT